MSSVQTRLVEAALAACVIITLGAMLPVSGCAPSVQPADLVILNAKIITLDESQASAEALAARDGRITAVGDDNAVRSLIGDSTTVLDLEGNLVVPGFIEGHAHFAGLGRSLIRLRLQDARNWDEIVAMVAEAAKKAEPGEWILGRGWHQDKWDQTPQPNVEGLPFHTSLSAVSPDNPVYLSHASGHSSIANAYAMELAGITRETKDPEGGQIVRDTDGNPIGVFRETADEAIYDAYQRYLDRRSPEEKEKDWREEVRLAARECLANGITSFQDAGSTYERIDFYRKLANEDSLRVRLWVMIGHDIDTLPLRIDDYPLIDSVNHRLTVRAVKSYVDGALGSHGAWLLEPYDDLPTSSGLNVTPLDDLRATAELAAAHDLQFCVHAIGDRGNREVLDIYESVLSTLPDGRTRRWRIEHAQHLHPDDIPRFAELGVIASMQAVHCTSDGPWVPSRIGAERSATGAYVWRDLIQSGAIISNGTDAPVEDVDPLQGFCAAVSRRMSNGEQFYPEQCLTREEALRACTINAAYAAFEEDVKGSISVGKLADLTVLSKDIMTIPEDEIRDAEVLYTIVGGKVLYQK